MVFLPHAGPISRHKRVGSGCQDLQRHPRAHDPPLSIVVSGVKLKCQLSARWKRCGMCGLGGFWGGVELDRYFRCCDGTLAPGATVRCRRRRSNVDGAERDLFDGGGGQG